MFVDPTPSSTGFEIEKGSVRVTVFRRGLHYSNSEFELGSLIPPQADKYLWSHDPVQLMERRW